MSSVLLNHGYFAVDTDRRSKEGARVFELRRPDGSLVEEYHGPIMDIFVAEMESDLDQDLMRTKEDIQEGER